MDLGRHTNGRSGKLHFVEMMGAGVAMFDADQDGDLDLLVLDGTPLPSPSTPPPQPTAGDHGARLYRNQLRETGKLVFLDATAASGLAATGYGFGVATGDYDGDGDVDLFLANYQDDQLWRNEGGGRFAEVGQSAGAQDGRWGAAATFFDFDRDGDLDLFVVNYVEAPAEREKPCFARTSRRDYCGPQVFPPVEDRLLRNRGDGTFEDVTRAAGLAGVLRPGLGVLAFDADADGWLDLYVADDGTANELWRNGGDGRFEEVALLAGAAVNADGQPEGSMGVTAGDFDQDGDDDLFLTHIDGEKNTLYVNLGGGFFEDRSARLGLAAPSLAFTGFGTRFLDVDHDGWLDLVVVNGAVRLLDALLAQGDPVALGQRKQLFRNMQGQRFEDWSEKAGPAFGRLEVSRGLAVGDVDDDGDADLLVGNNGGEPRLLLREGAPSAWLGLRLISGKRDALGARAILERPGLAALHRTAATDGSFGAASDPRLLFGLEGGPPPSALRVLWPDGRREVFAVPPPNRYTTLVQGEGSTPRETP